MRSPGTRLSSSTSAGVGVVITSSRCSTSRKLSGSVAGAGGIGGSHLWRGAAGADISNQLDTSWREIIISKQVSASRKKHGSAHQDNRCRLLYYPRLARRVAVGAGGDRCYPRRHSYAGNRGHRPSLRRRTVPLRCQSSRNQRHDRVFRAADVGDQDGNPFRRTGRLPRATRDGLSQPAAGGRRRTGRRRIARSAARLRAGEAAGVAAFQVHPDGTAHAGEDADGSPLQEHAATGDGDCRRACRAGPAHRCRCRAGGRG